VMPASVTGIHDLLFQSRFGASMAGSNPGHGVQEETAND
jgi:hypothetical protein